MKFLLNASAALMRGVASVVHDVEGIDDRLFVGEFFGGSVLKTVESIQCDNLDTLTPYIGVGGQPGFKDLLGAAWDDVKESGGAAAVADGHQAKNKSEIPVLMRGVAPYIFVHADDAHAVEPSWIIDQ